MEKSKLFKRTAIAAALLSPSFAVYAAVSPFAPLPLHMSGQVVSKADPNVLLVLDNSGSMGWIAEAGGVYPTFDHTKVYCEQVRLATSPAYYAVFTALDKPKGFGRCNIYYRSSGALYGTEDLRFCPSYADLQSYQSQYGWSRLYSDTALSWVRSGFRARVWGTGNTCLMPDAVRRSRMETLKETITNVINDPENAKVRWGVDYINPSATAVSVPLDGNNKSAMLSSIAAVQSSSGTPFTRAYISSVHRNFVVGNAIQYRCQKNFVIALTDGEANSGLVNNTAHTWFRNNWSYNTSPFDYATWSSNNQFNLDHGLEALSSIVANMDLRTTGNDNEGGSWEEDPFKTQNVITSTVGFAIDNNYLKNGAQGDGSAYYSANNAAQLSNAFKNILNNAVTSAKNASVTPAVNSGSSTNLGALSLTLDLTKANSTFQFTNITRSTRLSTGAVDATRSIEYGTLTNNSQNASRRVLVSKAGVAPKFLAKEDIDWTGYSDSSTPTREQVVDWLIRRSDKSDYNIGSNLRDRGDSTSSATDAKRMMGDVVNSSILQIGSAENDTANNKQYSPYLVTAANDGMVHIFARQNSNTKPFALKFNWIPGAAVRENGSSDATIWQAIQNTTRSNYVTDLTNGHTYLLDGGISYRQTYNGQIFAVGALGRGGKGAYALNVGGNQHHSASTKVGIDAAQADWATAVPLWETGNNAFAATKDDSTTWNANQQMGYTVGTPRIDRIATARNSGAPVFNNTGSPIRYAAAINNGYASSDALPSLYVYDALGQAMNYTVDSNNKPTTAQTPSYSAANVGKLLAKIQVPNDAANSATVSVVTDDGRTSINNGLSAPALVDIDFDGLIDVAYAGDLNGNLYRFDFRKDTPAQWTAQRVFKGSATNPITAAPSVYRMSNNKLIVMFGTGRDLHSSDLNDTNDQYFYGIYDNLKQDWKPAAATCSNSAGCQNELTVASRTSTTDGDKLLEQVLSEVTQGTTSYRMLSETRLESGHRGWFITLKVGSTSTGERVTVQPTVVDNAVFFTTRLYSGNNTTSTVVCSKTSGSGSSWVMGASVLNGGSLSDLTTNFGQITIPRGLVYFSGYAAQGIASGTSYTYNNPAFAGAYARNEQGQIQDGGDVDLTQSQKLGAATNFCGSPTSGDLTYADSDGGTQSFQLNNRRCLIKRISWREIF